MSRSMFVNIVSQESTLLLIEFCWCRATDLRMLQGNASHGSRCIKFKASQLWNTIPEELKLINKLNSFKNHLKSHLFNDIKY